MAGHANDINQGKWPRDDPGGYTLPSETRLESRKVRTEQPKSALNHIGSMQQQFHLLSGREDLSNSTDSELLSKPPSDLQPALASCRLDRGLHVKHCKGTGPGRDWRQTVDWMRGSRGHTNPGWQGHIQDTLFC